MADRYLCNFLQFGDAEFSKKFCIFFQKGLAKNISDEEETEEATVDDKDERDVKLPEEDMDTTVPSDSEEIEPSVPQISDEEETEEVTVDDKDKSILTVSQEANTPDTGDDSNFSMWILLLAIMGVFLGGFARKNNLCKKHENRRG